MANCSCFGIAGFNQRGGSKCFSDPCNAGKHQQSHAAYTLVCGQYEQPDAAHTVGEHEQPNAANPLVSEHEQPDAAHTMGEHEQPDAANSLALTKV